MERPKDEIDDQIAAAKKMEGWFVDFAYGLTDTIKQLPPLARQRIDRQLGAGDTTARLRTMSDLLFKLPTDDHQMTYALYLCGYPEVALQNLGLVSSEELIKELDIQLPPPKEEKVVSKTTPVKKAARRTLSEVGIDSIEEESKGVEDHPQIYLEDGLRVNGTGDDDAPLELLSSVSLTTDPVKDYLRQAGTHKLLSAAQEVELAKSMEAGALAAERLENQGASLSNEERLDLEYLRKIGERAFEQMTVANLRLVVSIARRYQGRGMSFLDIVQEGNEGLIRAVHKFDFTKGFKFSTYATWWIRQAITRALADKGSEIRIPVHAREQLNKIYKARVIMEQELERSPTEEELSIETGMPVDKIRFLMRADRESISLNKKIGDDSETEFGDLVGDAHLLQPEEQVASDSMQAYLRQSLGQLMGALSEREREVVIRRNGLEEGARETLDAIAISWGVSRERVRQIESKALKTLRKLAVEQDTLRQALVDID